MSGKGCRKIEGCIQNRLTVPWLNGENAGDGSESGVPGDGPVTMRLDEFGGFTFPDGEIKVSDGCCGSILSNSGEES